MLRMQILILCQFDKYAPAKTAELRHNHLPSTQNVVVSFFFLYTPTRLRCPSLILAESTSSAALDPATPTGRGLKKMPLYSRMMSSQRSLRPGAPRPPKSTATSKD